MAAVYSMVPADPGLLLGSGLPTSKCLSLPRSLLSGTDVLSQHGPRSRQAREIRSQQPCADHAAHITRLRSHGSPVR